MKKLLTGIFLLLLLSSCIDQNPNLNKEGEDIFEVNKVFVDAVDLPYQDTVYIPIYSDIYNESKDIKFNLTATLSIRNTSLRDSIFIEDIDYYDSNGKRIRQYLDENALLLVPMQSIEYVIEENDTEGGTGANFIVNWGAKHADVKPIFHGVMISTHGQQGISFLTEGISISVRKPEPNFHSIETNDE